MNTLRAKRKSAEAQAEEKKAKSEEISWNKWAELIKELGIMLSCGNDSKEVEDLIITARAMLNKLRMKEKKAEEEKVAKKITFEETGKNIGRLVDIKNAKYGDSFSKSGGVLRILYPDGIKLEQYDDMLTVCRILDKLFRVATDKDALGESPYTDIAGYCILQVNKRDKETP